MPANGRWDLIRRLKVKIISMLLTLTVKSLSHCEVRSYIEGTRKQKARLCNHFCRGNEISITYSERMFVAPVTKHEKLIRCIIMSFVRLYNIFPHRPLNGKIFRGVEGSYFT